MASPRVGFGMVIEDRPTDLYLVSTSAFSQSIRFRQGTSGIVSGVDGYTITRGDCNLFSLRIDDFVMLRSGTYECVHMGNTAPATLRIGSKTHTFSLKYYTLYVG